MRRALLVAALLVGVVLPGFATGPELPDNPLTGRRLFEGKQCNRCHGLSGIEPGIAFDLGDGHFGGSFLDLGAALWNHVPSMSVTFHRAGLAWPELSEEEAGELLAFLYFLDYLGRPGEAAAGERLFGQRGCAECHTLDRRGSPRGPDLGDLTRHASPLFIAQAIWNHGPAMLESIRLAGMRAPQFDDGDLADLAAFVRRAAAPGPQERQLLAPGNPNRGARVFRTEGCASCHGDDAHGGDLGPDLSRTDLHRSAGGIAGTMWNHALAMEETMRQRGVGWPELDVGELADLVAFLYFLPFVDPPGDAERGALLFRQRACAGCHEARAAATPDLAASAAARSAPALVAAMWSHAPVMKDAILAEGHPWPELSGRDLRDLLAHLGAASRATP